MYYFLLFRRYITIRSSYCDIKRVPVPIRDSHLPSSLLAGSMHGGMAGLLHSPRQGTFPFLVRPPASAYAACRLFCKQFWSTVRKISYHRHIPFNSHHIFQYIKFLSCGTVFCKTEILLRQTVTQIFFKKVYCRSYLGTIYPYTRKVKEIRPMKCHFIAFYGIMPPLLS